MTRTRLATFVPVLAIIAACASTPAPPPPAIPSLSLDEKLAATLRLEDARVLRDAVIEPEPVVIPIPAPPPVMPVVAPLVPPPPDLIAFLADGEARVRRRAALAAGRTGLAEAVDPLIARLSDPDPDVRQAVAFALGLLADRRARDPLIAALGDPMPLVQGGAAEALGLIGDAEAAPALSAFALRIVDSGALEPVPTDEDAARRDTSTAAFRFAIYALVRLRAYDALAAVVLDASGHPRVRWWPVAYALQRLADPRAKDALVALAGDSHPYTRAFAVKGLGGLMDRSVVPILIPLAEAVDRSVAIEAVRGLARLGDASAEPALVKLAEDRLNDAHVRLEAVTALATVRGEGADDLLIDLLSDSSPPIRAAAITALAARDPQDFVFILSGLDPDSHWSVRGAVATVLGTLKPESGLPRLRLMLSDSDQRVVPSALAAIVRLAPPDTADILIKHLEADDAVVRQAAATALGTLRPPQGLAALEQAYTFGERDLTYVARAAALAALAQYGDAAKSTLVAALADKDWAIRVRAAQLLRQMNPSVDVQNTIRPVPSARPAEFYATPALHNPSVSTQAFIDTDYGSIQIELAVIDAPLTVANFVSLARRGFYDGVPFHRIVPNFVIQGGDPRGDGEGGPGYTIRDELNDRPYLRGTVGMALDWQDTSGSQFFITHSPQPHLDARYTVFGRVIDGMAIVDQIRPWDTIHRIRIWDGTIAE